MWRGRPLGGGLGISKLLLLREKNIKNIQLQIFSKIIETLDPELDPDQQL
jgi:hypothetical protein